MKNNKLNTNNKDSSAQMVPDDLSEIEAIRLRKSGILAEALNPAAGTDTNHLSLNELRQMLDQRVLLGENWEMPEHLLACPLCLEAFQCLQEGIPELTGSALARFNGLFKPATTQTKPSRAKIQWTARILKMAAAILLLAAGTMLVFSIARPVTRLHSGTFVIEHKNQALTEKNVLPENTLLVAREETSAVFNDGATALFDPDSRVIINRSLAGDTIINLQQGRVDASVPKQKQDRHFIVQTPLGDVRVIGTRFSVTTESEKVMVYENSGEPLAHAYDTRVSAVTVKVESGTVAVDNHFDQVKITAGQCATMREGQKLIEVRGTAQ